jgi:hypothetical protein
MTAAVAAAHVVAADRLSIATSPKALGPHVLSGIHSASFTARSPPDAMLGSKILLRSWLPAPRLLLVLVALAVVFIIFTASYDSLARQRVRWSTVEFLSDPKNNTIVGNLAYPDGGLLGSRPAVVVFHGFLASRQWMLSLTQSE